LKINIEERMEGQRPSKMVKGATLSFKETLDFDSPNLGKNNEGWSVQGYY
jgi:hypothetical protein